MLIYGKNSCREVLGKDIPIKKIYLQVDFNDNEILSLVEKRKLNVITLPKNKMNDLADGIHQGIIVDVPDYKYGDLDSIFGDNKFVVMLDHLEDVHNFGAIIRTCEAAGVDGIIIPNDREVDVNPTVIKTSVGTAYDVNIIKVVNLNDTIKQLKDNGYWVVGTSLDTDTDYKSVDYSGNICLVIGNEGKGMSSLVTKNCDFVVKIPMVGKTNSLNASVAAGIMIYEIIGNRKR